MLGAARPAPMIAYDAPRRRVFIFSRLLGIGWQSDILAAAAVLWRQQASRRSDELTVAGADCWLFTLLRARSQSNRLGSGCRHTGSQAWAWPLQDSFAQMCFCARIRITNQSYSLQTSQTQTSLCLGTPFSACIAHSIAQFILYLPDPLYCYTYIELCIEYILQYLEWQYPCEAKVRRVAAWPLRDIANILLQ